MLSNKHHCVDHDSMHGESAKDSVDSSHQNDSLHQKFNEGAIGSFENSSTVDIQFSPPAASTPEKHDSMTVKQDSAVYKTDDQVTVSVRSALLACRIIQVCGKPGFPLYQLQCRYGILK